MTKTTETLEAKNKIGNKFAFNKQSNILWVSICIGGNRR